MNVVDFLLKSLFLAVSRGNVKKSFDCQRDVGAVVEHILVGNLSAG